MGTHINKTNADNILRKIANGLIHGRNINQYGIYSNKCFDTYNDDIAIVSPERFTILVKQYIQLAKRSKMSWKGLVDLFYKNELLPFAHSNRNSLHFKFLYHGSDTQFEPGAISPSKINSNNIANGHADGYGIYLTTDINTALRYGRYLYIYIWNINHFDICKISESRNTIPQDFYKELFIKLNDSNDYLSNYGDVEYEGLDTVMQYALNDITEDDVSNINGIINVANGGAEGIDEMLAEYGYGYTVNKNFNDQIIVYNNSLITPYNRILDSHLGNPIQIN